MDYCEIEFARRLGLLPRSGFRLQPRVATAATLGMEFQSVSIPSGLRPLLWLKMSGSPAETSTDPNPPWSATPGAPGLFIDQNCTITIGNPPALAVLLDSYLWISER